MASLRARALLCLGLLVRGPAEQLLKVRLFWIRHGLSCANVLDRCALEPPVPPDLLKELELSLRHPALPPRFRNASLNKAFAVAAATKGEPDCKVEIEGAGLEAGAQGESGGVVRVHDLYLDPALTACSRRQSLEAGLSFIKWLEATGTQLHFVGSSVLMRAVETAYAMFLEACGRVNCTGVLGQNTKVIPVPYLNERAPRGLTAVQADNVPRDIDEQNRMIEAVYGGQLRIDRTFAEVWPRHAQQYEKFKAFLAVELLPSLGLGVPLGSAGGASFREALEADLPESMQRENYGEPVKLEWEGGIFQSGPGFSKEEYTALEVPEVNLAIVGHSQMMTEYCQQGRRPKPNNNAVLEKLFILRSEQAEAGRGARRVLRELDGDCAKVMDAPSTELSLGSLVEADVATCSSPFQVSKFLKLPSGSSVGSTPCVKLASDGAYPIQPQFRSERTEL